MKLKIYELIDLICGICTDNYSAENITNELESIDKKIEFLKEKIADHQTKIESKTYENLELRQEDELEIKKLKSKLNRNKVSFNDIKSKLQGIKNNKNKVYDNLVIAKENKEIYSELIRNLTNKLVLLTEDKEVYEKIIRENEVKLDFWNNKTLSYEEKYHELATEENLLRSTKEDLENEIYHIKEKISELEKRLNSNNSYFDSEKKSADLKIISQTEEEIKKLETKKLEIQTELSYLVKEFKDYVKEDKYYEASLKLSEIWAIIYSIKYTQIDDINELKAIYKELQKEYLMLQNNIKVNNYELIGQEEINDRLHIIEMLKEENQHEIEKIKEIIEQITSKKSIDLWNTISSLKISDELKVHYDNDLNHLVEYSLILNNTSLKYLETYQEKLIKESEFQKNKLTNGKVIEDESKKLKDIERIKELTVYLNLINKKISAKKEFRVIKHEIELLLSSLDFEDIKVEKTRKAHKVIKIIHLDTTTNETIEINNDITIDDLLKMTEI